MLAANIRIITYICKCKIYLLIKKFEIMERVYCLKESYFKKTPNRAKSMDMIVSRTLFSSLDSALACLEKFIRLNVRHGYDVRSSHAFGNVSDTNLVSSANGHVFSELIMTNSATGCKYVYTIREYILFNG